MNAPSHATAAPEKKPPAEKHTNRLAGQTSPYLLQHVHNPVNWYPWGEEALARARKENKPIFLSIGYSACHWCHVMERESFEDAETARILNKYFIPNKILALWEPGTDEPGAIDRFVPLLKGKQMIAGKTTVYVCENYSCKAPVNDPAALERMLATPE